MFQSLENLKAKLYVDKIRVKLLKAVNTYENTNLIEK